MISNTTTPPSPALDRSALVHGVLRVVFALFFLWTGVPKLVDPLGFTLAVRGYDLLPDPWPAWAAMAVPVIEIVVALALLIGWGVLGAWLLAGGTLVVFTGAIISAWTRGLDIDCGCFASLEGKTNYPLHVGVNALLILICAVGAWLAARAGKK
jgi:putative oxidoreductase